MKQTTKVERLQELKQREDFEKALDTIFDRDWKIFVSGIRMENAIWNKRLLRIVIATKGEDFVTDLLTLMKLMGEQYSKLHVCRNPKGMRFAESRVKSIPEIWATQSQVSIYGRIPKGVLYVQVKPNRWLYFHYVLAK